MLALELLEQARSLRMGMGRIFDHRAECYEGERSKGLRPRGGPVSHRLILMRQKIEGTWFSKCYGGIVFRGITTKVHVSCAGRGARSRILRLESKGKGRREFGLKCKTRGTSFIPTPLASHQWRRHEIR